MKVNRRRNNQKALVIPKNIEQHDNKKEHLTESARKKNYFIAKGAMEDIVFPGIPLREEFKETPRSRRAFARLFPTTAYNHGLLKHLMLRTLNSLLERGYMYAVTRSKNHQRIEAALSASLTTYPKVWSPFDKDIKHSSRVNRTFLISLQHFKVLEDIMDPKAFSSFRFKLLLERIDRVVSPKYRNRPQKKLPTAQMMGGDYVKDKVKTVSLDIINDPEVIEHGTRVVKEVVTDLLNDNELKNEASIFSYDVMSKTVSKTFTKIRDKLLNFFKRCRDNICRIFDNSWKTFNDMSFFAKILAIGAMTTVVFTVCVGIGFGITRGIMLLAEYIERKNYTVPKYVAEAHCAEAQGGTKSVLSILGVVISLATGKEVNLREITDITRVSSFSESVVDDVFEHIQKVSQYCAYLLTGDETYKYLDELVDIKEAIQEAGRILLIPNVKSAIVTDKILAKRVTAIYRHMISLVPIVNGLDRSKTLIVQSFRTHQLSMTNLYMNCIQNSELYSSRVEPLTILFAGPPGQGKTTCGNALIRLLYQYMHRRFPDKYPEGLTDAELVYTKSQTSQYWAKYANHFATVHDEFLQSKEPAEQTRSLIEITQMVSSGTYVLDMADLHQKGTVCFNSDVLLIMSNLQEKGWTSLPMSDPGAFFRRMHVPLEVIKVKEIKPNASQEDFLAAWRFKLLPHAKARGRDVYTGTDWAWFEKDTDTFSMAEVIVILCNIMEQKHTEKPLTGWANEGNCDALLDSLVMGDAQMLRGLNMFNYGKEKATSSDSEDWSDEGVYDYENFVDDVAGVYDDALEKFEEFKDMCDPSPIIDEIKGTFYRFNAGQHLSARHELIEKKKKLIEAFDEADDSGKTRLSADMRNMCVEMVSKSVPWSRHAEKILVKFFMSGDWRHILESIPLTNIMFAELFDSKVKEIILLNESINRKDFEEGGLKPNCFELLTNEAHQKTRLNTAVEFQYLSNTVYNECMTEILTKNKSFVTAKYQYVDSVWNSITETISWAWESFLKLMSMPFRGFSLEHGITRGWNIDYVSEITSIAAITVLCGSVATIVGVLIKKACDFFSSESNVLAQGDYMKNPAYLKGLRKRNRYNNRGVLQRKAALANASNHVSDPANKVATNVSECIFDFGLMTSRCKIIFLEGRLAATAGHCASVLGRLQTITIINGGKDGGDIKVDQFTLNFCKDRDLVFILFDKSFPSRPSLKKMMISREEFLQVESDSCVRVHTWDGKTKMRQLVPCGEVTPITSPFKSCLTVNGVQHFIDYNQFMAVYDGRGESGDCGLPYLSDCSRPALLGIHIASYNSDGLLAPVFIEDLAESGACAQCRVVPSFLPKVHPTPKYREGVTPMGSLDRVIGGKPKNDLFKTALNDQGIPETEAYRPAIFDLQVEPARVSNEPGWQAWSKADLSYVKTHTPPMPKRMRSMMNLCPNTLWAGFAHTNKVDYVPKRLTMEQALFGIPGILSSMDGSSSPGMTGLYNRQKRNDYFNLDEQWISEEFRSRVEEYREIAKTGNIPVMDGVENLKIELRAINKPPRMFCGVGSEHVTWTKMVLGDLLNHLKKHNWMSSCAVGINPHSMEWHILGTKVLQPGMNRIGGDFSGCDVTVPHYVTHLLFLFANSWYNYVPESDDYKELDACCQSIAQMFRVRQREVFMLNRGHASGHYLTSFYNSFWGFVMHRYIFLTQYPESTEEEWYDAVNLVVFGDDNIGCVSPDYPKFNMVEISNIIRKEFGMIYTLPNKKEVTEPYINDAVPEFLSRTFRLEKGIYRGPLNKDSIYGMLLYVRKSSVNSAAEQLSQNLGTAEMEMYHYGREEFNKFQCKLKEVCRERNVLYESKSYDFYNAKYASGGDNYRVDGLNSVDTL